MADDDRWMIWSNKHGAWWVQNLHGYTLDLDAAGVFTRAAAEKATVGAIVGADGVPTSVIVRAAGRSMTRPRAGQSAQSAETLRTAAAGRRAYARHHQGDKTMEHIVELLELQATTLDLAAQIADGDTSPLYRLLPVYMWSEKMHRTLLDMHAAAAAAPTEETRDGCCAARVDQTEP